MADDDHSTARKSTARRLAAKSHRLSKDTGVVAIPQGRLNLRKKFIGGSTD
jgi:hypothetical protein